MSWEGFDIYCYGVATVLHYLIVLRTLTKRKDYGDNPFTLPIILAGCSWIGFVVALMVTIMLTYDYFRSRSRRYGTDNLRQVINGLLTY